MPDVSSLYDIQINSLSGEPINLSDYRGKKILFVNVASQCIFTSQYRELQELYDEFRDILVIIAIPCNQFGEQEPGGSREIQSFCQLNYNVSFLITEKLEVKGKGEHPLYKWLTTKSKNRKKSSSVKWNFQKYLVDERGNLIDYYLIFLQEQNLKIQTKILSQNCDNLQNIFLKAIQMFLYY